MFGNIAQSRILQDMIRLISAIPAAFALALTAASVNAQQVDRNDYSQPTPGEIAMAAECRDTYESMKAVEKKLKANRDEINIQQIKINKFDQQVEEAKADYERKAKDSGKSEKHYQEAIKAREAYEAKANEYNKLIDAEIALKEARTKLNDEFYVLNPNYVRKCSGTIFKALSVILACKDEQSEWCDLLK